MWMSKPEKKEINSSNLMLRSMPSAKPGEREKKQMFPLDMSLYSSQPFRVVGVFLWP